MDQLAPRVASNPGTADKLRGMADKLQSEIDHKFADRLSNTPKRQREAATARQEGTRLQRTQQAMRALVPHYDAGTVPAELRGVTTKAAIYDLCRSRIDRTNAGYYDAGFDTNTPAIDSDAARAIWALLSAPSAEQQKAELLRVKLDKLRFSKIPGYFPTPTAIIDQMIEAAQIPGWASAGAGCRMLEPSAGSGSILDRLKKEYGNALLHAYEVNHSLREILESKGHRLAGDDFAQSDTAQKYHRILMNPPFENGQDAQHVMRAHQHLAPGGRLVAIMSPGPFFRQDSKSRAFREWFDNLGGEKSDLPAGSFKESGTGTSSVLVVIDA